MNNYSRGASNVGGAAEVKRGAAYARDKIGTLLSSLHTTNTSGRQKALRKFEEYYFTFRPDLEENDARTLLEGDALRRGLVQECGAMSENHVGELKKTGAEVRAKKGSVPNPRHLHNSLHVRVFRYYRSCAA